MSEPRVELVRPEKRDAPELGRICFEAFKAVHDRHSFPRDLQSIEVATQLMELLVSRPDYFGVAARVAGRLAGSNFLSVSGAIGGVGPITVDPTQEGRGVGRLLMEEVLTHAKSNGQDQVRLVQDSFNTRSFSLYASLGFEPRETLGLMEIFKGAAGDPNVRPATGADEDAMDELSRRAYGCSRRAEIASALRLGHPAFVREQAGRATGYWMPGFFGHGVAQSEQDALGLVGEAARQVPIQYALFFCPLTLGGFFRASLKAGHRLRKIMNLMSIGPYRRPEGIWMPSVGY